MLPKLLKMETILIAWSSTRTKSLETEPDKFKVIVYRSAIPTNMP